jgi:hypothetical protein
MNAEFLADTLVYKYTNEENSMTVACTVEMAQDIEFKARMIRRINRMATPFTDEEIAEWQKMLNDSSCAGMILTDEPTDQEIAEWKEAYEFIKNVNVADAKKKYNIQIIHDESEPMPYEPTDVFPWEPYAESWDEQRRKNHWDINMYDSSKKNA